MNTAPTANNNRETFGVQLLSSLDAFCTSGTLMPSKPAHSHDGYGYDNSTIYCLSLSPLCPFPISQQNLRKQWAIPSDRLSWSWKRVSPAPSPGGDSLPKCTCRDPFPPPPPTL
eukprot:TRINITY_DN132_c5_g1_i1.p1 TRINITY_DN132_c5_g1~~TRINITY_DN132_c5_g1_i1.p1  ORF type:complete len:114 (+),score=11.44 TRINITY_DN132_c5_g1_i1:312-653(+)